MKKKIRIRVIEEDREYKTSQTTHAMHRMGCSILAHISVTQKLLEAMKSGRALDPLRRDWQRLCVLYREHRFDSAKGFMGEVVEGSVMVLKEQTTADREAFLNEMFLLGYTGWVNEMDRRLSA